MPHMQGGFAKCYLVTAEDTQQQYAMKIVPRSTLVKRRAKDKVCVCQRPFAINEPAWVTTIVRASSAKHCKLGRCTASQQRRLSLSAAVTTVKQCRLPITAAVTTASLYGNFDCTAGR